MGIVVKCQEDRKIPKKNADESKEKQFMSVNVSRFVLNASSY